MSVVVSLSDRRHSKRLSVDLVEAQHRILKQAAVDGDVNVAHIIRAMIQLFHEQSSLHDEVLQHAAALKQEERQVS